MNVYVLTFEPASVPIDQAWYHLVLGVTTTLEAAKERAERSGSPTRWDDVPHIGLWTGWGPNAIYHITEQEVTE